ncbi:hypothetical protein [Blastococcus brunescens]|uniref:Uncharacterized protein n=1 Tax=Blastococcus brunescens TaxID=1564165 RepID=A0ABZ1B0M3_9ACTN|nr:hypothetical protein [Blastococcus sp. BMG 8361]WRL62869.1 hypothetical protein U6N30_23760 [Blastococcus sp. BMG 8361]
MTVGPDGARLQLSSWGGPGWPELEPDPASSAGSATSSTPSATGPAPGWSCSST